jgi:hypothetical protein
MFGMGVLSFSDGKKCRGEWRDEEFKIIEML